MINAAGTSDSTWFLALNHATQLFNQTHLTPDKQLTRYEAYHGIKPDLSEAIPFGCLCFILATKAQHHDMDSFLDPRCFAGIYMGPYGQYGPHRGWKGTALTGAASGGLMYLCGDPQLPPTQPSNDQAYQIASLVAVSTALVALAAVSTSIVERLPSLEPPFATVSSTRRNSIFSTCVVVPSR